MGLAPTLSYLSPMFSKAGRAVKYEGPGVPATLRTGSTRETNPKELHEMHGAGYEWRDGVFVKAGPPCAECTPHRPCRKGWALLGYDAADYDRRYPAKE